MLSLHAFLTNCMLSSLLSYHVTTSCYHLILSSHVIVVCCHPMFSLRVITPSFHPFLSPYVVTLLIIPCYHPQVITLRYHFFYHLMLLPFVIIPDDNSIHFYYTRKLKSFGTILRKKHRSVIHIHFCWAAYFVYCSGCP
jgi:hypothetical protein